MDKKKSSRGFVKIDSHESLTKFVEENKNKIPKGVKVERAFSLDDKTIPEDGIVIHARTFNLGLYLPFHPLIREILSRLSLVPTQLTPNCWRIMFGIIALNQICKINLGWNEFCYCYAVKQHSPGTYYFSHKKSNSVLVTDLPKSEKAWKLDDLICLNGHDCWERRPGDTTDTLHLVPTGLKHQNSDVKHLDIKKALDLSSEDRNWKNLLTHPAYLELYRESKIADESQVPSLMTAMCPPHNSLGSYAQSIELVDQSEKTTDDLSSPSSNKKQKLIHSDSTTSNSIAANLVLPNSCFDYELTITSEAVSKSKATVDNINQQGSKDQETSSDQSKKNINNIDQLLKHKIHEEVRLQVAQLFGKVQSIVDSLLNRIKELEASKERKDKALEEWKLLKKEEPVINTESLKKCCEENENLKKEVTELKGNFGNFLEKIQADMTQMKAQQCHIHAWMELGLSKNKEPLTSQSQNHHMKLKLCTTPNYQNDIPGNENDQQQQQTIELSSSKGSNLMQVQFADAPIFSVNNFDYPLDHQNSNFDLDLSLICTPMP